MIKRIIQVPKFDGSMCDATVFAEFGPLALTRRLEEGKEYRITHLRTGRAFGYFKTQKAARNCIQKILDLDWAFDGAGSEALKEPVFAAIREVGGAVV